MTSRHANKTRKTDSGFTLLELMMGLVLIAILAAGAFFSLYGLRHKEKVTICYEILEKSILNMRSRAVAENQTYRLKIEGSSPYDQICLQSQAQPGDPWLPSDPCPAADMINLPDGTYIIDADGSTKATALEARPSGLFELNGFTTQPFFTCASDYTNQKVEVTIDVAGAISSENVWI